MARRSIKKIGFLKTFKYIYSDVVARIEYEKKRISVLTLISSFFHPANMVVMIGRLQKIVPFPFSRICASINIVLFGCEIHKESYIGKRFLLLSSIGLLLHDNTEIGDNCIFFHHTTTTIGPRENMDIENDCVRIGNNVIVEPGVRFVGNFSIGDSSYVRANSLVTKSAPPYSILCGVPAKITGTTRVELSNKETVNK